MGPCSQDVCHLEQCEARLQGDVAGKTDSVRCGVNPRSSPYSVCPGGPDHDVAGPPLSLKFMSTIYNPSPPPQITYWPFGDFRP